MIEQHLDAPDRGTTFATVSLTALSLIAMLVTTSACNVGPDYVRPKVRLNADWSGKGDSRLGTRSGVDTLWWRSFEDPTLDRLIENAFRQNLPLRIAALRIMEARARLAMASGEGYPDGGLGASGQAVKLSEHAPNAANLDHFFGEYQLGFDAAWELDFWGKYRRGARAESAAVLATVAEYDDALVSLTAEVARTYVVIRTFEVLVQQARENVTLQEEGQEIALSRFRNGATSELDVAQATNLLETTRASIPKLVIGLQQAVNALGTLVGRPSQWVRSLLETPRGIPRPPTQVAVGVPAKMLRRRPDIRAAEYRAMEQCERIGVKKADLYPSFTLFGSIGVHSSIGGNADQSGKSSVAGIFTPGGLASTAGGSVFWPILNYPVILNNVRIEDARFQQALVAYVNTVITAAQEVEDGIVGFLKQQDALVFEENAVTAAESSVQLALVQYREGATDYQRVLDTQRVLLASQNSLTDTHSAATTNLIALYKALGGGWELRRGRRIIPVRTQHDMEERTDWGSHFEE